MVRSDTFRVCAAFLSICLLAVTGSAMAADNPKFKKVPAAKYETKAPAKDFSFARLRNYEPKEHSGTEHLKRVVYTAKGKYYTINGVIDLSGAQPRWVVEPRYRDIEAGGPDFSFARKMDGTWCIKRHMEKGCQDIGRVKLSAFLYSENGSGTGRRGAPFWAAPVYALAIGEDKRTATATLFTPEGAILGQINNLVLASYNAGGGHGVKFSQIFSVGSAAIARVRNADGVVHDVAVLPDPETGALTFNQTSDLTILPGYKVLTLSGVPSKKHVLFFTADSDDHLYFPIYTDQLGYKAAPGNLIGIRPMGMFPFEREYTNDYYVPFELKLIEATHGDILCCRKNERVPAGWVAKWQTEVGDRWAIVSLKGTLPSYDEIMRSVTGAHYRDVGTIVSDRNPGKSYGKMRDRRWINGLYLVHENGTAEIYKRGCEDRSCKVFTMSRSKTMPARNLESYMIATIRESEQWAAQREKDRIAQFKAQMEARKRAERQRAIQRSAAMAEQRRQNAAYAAYQRQQRIEKWNAYVAERNRYIEATRPAPPPSSSSRTWYTPPDIDYWSGVSKFNTSGYYLSRSGARTNCRIGSGQC
ncbi:hypothetical protein [Alterisphingorhabdus coralli]|uniref:WG repeat-containing protein n=1 Tax=Alterisphingorhabdus coralli TaxID=3071408 RepID=A0AA97FB10_9SPHN|nr:hypothetical protein [Parasphingorhabdus sp. SCSIO 66989]WOE75775.1 hypothetical protein RB602_03410 [Parasphingorhabdus sp. SCSIO 66989]